MAEMVPDRMPAGSSLGEKRLFEVLSGLPDDCIVYHEPLVDGRYPDFVVVMPEHGLLIAEVKGWRANSIIRGDSKTIYLHGQNGEEAHQHPLAQALGYMHKLRDRCRTHSETVNLVHQDGPKKGKFIFPFGHFAILSQIGKEQINERSLHTVFPPRSVLDADELDAWGSFTPNQLMDRLATFFDPRWAFPRLSPRQVDVLRAVLHPEIRVSPTIADLAIQQSARQERLLPHEEQPLKVLDTRQERSARSIGNGHRVLYGTAGSGKTVLLIARARLLSQTRPTSLILLLCYNVSLASYLGAVLRDCPNVTVHHFHGWASHHHLRFSPNQSNDEFGEALLSRLNSPGGQSGTYDAVLIDEVQDFAASWVRCAVAALKEPRDGDLLIVGDGSQGLYKQGRFTWSSVGVQAKGRTIHKRLDLDKNYRNTRQILLAAKPFAPSQSVEDEDGIVAAGCDPACAVREGARPLLVQASTLTDQCDRAFDVVRGLLAGTWGSQRIDPLDPSQIGILYVGTHLGDFFHDFRKKLTTLAPLIWIHKPKDGQADERRRVAEPGIKLHTIQSAKGLQYKAVVVLFLDKIPYDAHDDDDESPEERDRRLVYVALTRAEEYLAITYKNPNNIYVRQLRTTAACDDLT